MKTSIAFLLFLTMIIIRIAYHPSQPPTAASPFTSPSTDLSLMPAETVKPHVGANERLILKWVIGDNREGVCRIDAASVNEYYEIAGNKRHAETVN